MGPSGPVFHRLRATPRLGIRAHTRFVSRDVLRGALGLAGGAYLYAHQTLNLLAAHSTQVKQAERILQRVPGPSRPVLPLIAGYDQRMAAENGGYVAPAHAGAGAVVCRCSRLR